MHPVQHDLRGSVPASGHVAGHLVVGVPRQAKVQDLERNRERKRRFRLIVFQLDAAQRTVGHPPSAHSLHSPPDYWALSPAREERDRCEEKCYCGRIGCKLLEVKAKTILREVLKKNIAYCARPSLFSALAQAQHIKAEEMSRTETAATYSVDDISGVDVLQREENVH